MPLDLLQSKAPPRKAKRSTTDGTGAGPRESHPRVKIPSFPGDVASVPEKGLNSRVAVGDSEQLEERGLGCCRRVYAVLSLLSPSSAHRSSPHPSPRPRRPATVTARPSSGPAVTTNCAGNPGVTSSLHSAEPIGSGAEEETTS